MLRQDLAINDLTSAEGPLTSVLAALGVEVADGSAAKHHALEAALQGIIEAISKTHDQAAGDFPAVSGRLRDLPAQQMPAASRPGPPPPSAAPRFSEAFNDYIVDKVADQIWVDSSEAGPRIAARIFIDLCGDLTLAQVTSETAR